MSSSKGEMYTLARKAEQSITGERWCGQCQQRKKIEGGTWKFSHGGQRRRWMCLSCTNRQIERREEKRALAADTASLSTAG